MIRTPTYAVLRCARLKSRAATSARISRRSQSSEASAAIASSSTFVDPPPVASTSRIEPRPRPSRRNARSSLQSSTGAATAFEGQPGQVASSVQEQLAVAEVCLATGNLLRAKRIFHSIRKAFEEDKAMYHFEGGGNASNWTSAGGRRSSKMSEVIPASVHTAFLRSHFRQALAYGSSNTSGASTRKRALVVEAWDWFEMLLQHEKAYGRLEDSAWAVMLKGLIATRTVNPNPRTQDSSQAANRSMAYLYSLMQVHRRSLENIMRDAIFSHTGLAGLNDHPKLEALQELMSVLSDEGQTEALGTVEAVRGRLINDVRYQPDQATAEAAEQSSNELVVPPERLEELPELQPAKRTDTEAVPFRLGSLLGNLTTISGQRRQTSDPYVRQDLLEESAYDAARWQNMHDNDQLDKIGLATEIKLKGNALQGYMKTWHEKLTELLKDQLSEDGKAAPTIGDKMGESDLVRLMQLMSPDKLAFMTVVETLKLAGAGSLQEGVKATRAIISLGRLVEDEYGAAAWKDLYPDLYDQAIASTAGAREPRLLIRKFMMEQGINAGAAKAARQEGYGDEADDLLNIEDVAERTAKMKARERALPWTQKMRAKVGGYLIKGLLDVAFVERKEQLPSGEWVVQEQPAFYQSYQYQRGTKIGVLKLNAGVAQRLDKDELGLQVFPRFLPMLVPPKPWTKWNSGGYRIHSTDIMRIQDSPEQIQYLKSASEQGHLDEVFAALDVLGQTPWQINREVFDVVSQVWNSGEAIADIPIDNADIKIPDPPSPPPEQLKDPRIREAYRVKVKMVRNDRAKAHSQRCDLNYKLEIAKAYLNETFYFPHNLDFRGRAYPIPPNLSHIGDDMSRGLLKFAEKKKLGPKGLKWLHIQIANSYGYDKASFDDREQWTKDHLPKIYESADTPLDGSRWWLKADDPWQCLAACKELTHALRSANPEQYESSLPVQQDGTCNGLQHYAALGGDENGARQVNLAQGDKPADVYTAVANLVNAELDKDVCDSDPQVRNTALALQGKVTRKVVKQTVMTTVYGVTFIGAKRQIQRQLRDRGDIPLEDQYRAATYLAERVLSSIGDLFQGATAIQIWLSVCARLIGRSVRLEQDGSLPADKTPMASVTWTSPLGLPVAQPYRKQKKTQIFTALQSVFITDPNAPATIDGRAQATAFAPNFVHSLDATHMMLTAIDCRKAGLAFASVHDSYWTHACDIDRMSEILRDCFIRLHSQDLLGDLRRDFAGRYADFVVKQGVVTKYAQSLRIRAAGADGGSSKDAISELAQDMGPSALPPLAVAAERRLMAEALKEVEDARSEEEEEALEERSFLSEQDSEDLETDSAEDEVKRGRGRPKKSDPPRAKKVKKAKKVRSARGSNVYLALPELLPDVPQKGTFDLERIRTSPYFFS